MLVKDEIIDKDEVLKMARQAGMMPHSIYDFAIYVEELEAFAKLVAAKAVAKDRVDFDIDELCARQNKIGYKQGYRAGQTDEREACALICDDLYRAWTLTDEDDLNPPDALDCKRAIRARGEA